MRGKLIAGFGLIILALAVVTAIAHRGVTAIQESQRNLYEEEVADLIDIKDIRADQTANRADVLNMMFMAKPSEHDALRKGIQQRYERVDKALQILAKRSKNRPARLARIQEFESLKNAIRETRESAVFPLISAGKPEDAKKLVTGVQAERNAKLKAIADALVEDSEQRAQSALAQAEQTARESVRIFELAGAIAVLLSIAMALWIVVSLRRVTRDISEGVNVLASSASEITASTTQVASGSAETAAAVSQTTATVEEVKQTAQVSAKKAKYVSETAQKTVQISQGGQKSMDESIEAMHRIQAQMESIAHS
ncbi:MAG: MCP four helix bundle domain-containing protein, partial [Polaromonas sp.]